MPRDANEIPAYETKLDAYHRAFAETLSHVVSLLPIRPADRVMDAGCGDGFYTGLLAQRLKKGGTVIAVDASQSYLTLARRRLARHPSRRHMEFRIGRIEKLPFPDNFFDFVWCAQSLYSFPEPRAALRELRRVAKPGGVVAILENDSVHQILFPWPVGLELLLRAAELKAFLRQEAHPEKFYVGRSLRALFKQNGLAPGKTLARATTCDAPLTADERSFFDGNLTGLRDRVWPLLTPRLRRRCAPFLTPRHPRYVLKDPNLCVTVVDHVLWGRKTIRRPGKRAR
jgi:ubiquinone/menaquinone biosynthesis C-methylase UbiE